MMQINISDLDANLAADIDGVEGFEAFFDATVSNQGYHIVFSREIGRGGIVFVGSGSSGHTQWTDAVSPDEVLSRYLSDDMTA